MWTILPSTSVLSAVDTQTYIGDYCFGNEMIYDEKTRCISQKCLIAFYAQKEILQIS